MKSIKKTLGILVTAVCVITAAYIFISVISEQNTGKIQLKLAHSQAKDSEIADSVALLSEIIAEDESMNMEIEIYPSGVLGSEKELIEMVQAGVLDMAKISSNTLGQFDDKYGIFALPYLFTGQEHYYEAMANSDEIQNLFVENEEDGYIAIGYYANGARNFYLKEDVAVTDTSVLKGKKIRSMPSSISMKMIELMGGSPVPMSASETYTSLQQGIIDGAENTELALTVDKHAELVSSYTYTEHQYSPDIYIISTKAWNQLNSEQQEYLKAGYTKINDNFVDMYNRMMEEAIQEAEEMNTTIYRDIDKTEFIEAVQPMHEEFTSKGDEYKTLYEDIQIYSDKEEK